MQRGEQESSKTGRTGGTRLAWRWVIVLCVVGVCLGAVVASRYRDAGEAVDEPPAPAAVAAAESDANVESSPPPAVRAERPWREGAVVVAPPVAPEAAMPVGLPHLVDVGADHCAPCKRMAPMLAELRESFGERFRVTVVNLSVTPSAGDAYRVNELPTQIFYDGAGRELFRHVGYYSRDEILATWRRLGVAVD